MVTLPLTAVAVCLFISAVEPQAFTIHTENSRINVTIGSNAFFSVRPSAEARRGSWDFGATNIVAWLGSEGDLSNEYRTRAELFLPNGSLLLKSVTASDSGEYTVTMIPINGSQATATITLRVLEPVSNVTVSANNSKPVENIDTILLTCHVSGFVQSRIWFKNNQAVQDNDRIITSPDNFTLTIISVNRNDSGTYKCNASSDFSSDSGDTILQINHGPENVIITPPGPVWVELGKALSFHCSALSVPVGAYEWYNGTNLLKTGQIYRIDSISSNHGGNYTCQVNNNITKKGSNATIQLIVKEQSDAKNKLSAGAIAGIVIGVIVLLVIIGIIAWVIKKKTYRAKGGSQPNDIKMASPGNTLSSQTEYATVERKQPHIQKPVPSSNGTSTESTEPRNPDVVYAQPKILQQDARAPNATAVDNKTDYAELKFR